MTEPEQPTHSEDPAEGADDPAGYDEFEQDKHDARDDSCDRRVLRQERTDAQQ